MMFDESADWGDGADLDASLREALLSKPVAKKSRNKYRPESDGTGGRKRKAKAAAVVKKEEEGEVKSSKRKRVKREPGEKRAKHVKCSVFDDMEGWDDIITSHEAEDNTGENLAEYFKSAAEEIRKENAPSEANIPKKKKGKKKKVKFEGDEQNLLSQSMTTGSKALSALSLEGEEEEDGNSVTESTTSSTMQTAKDKISKLKGKFQAKMDASQFRYINEKLYTSSAEDAQQLFEKKPELFDVYHRGFTNQVEKWEVNPVDRIIELIKSKGDAVSIADFGCGDAKIAQSVTNPVFSFDLVKTNEHVIVANSKKVPLGNKTIDVAVFCLSLMGTDFREFIREARRVLKSKGTLVIAEVSSRIPNVDAFTAGVEELGFKLLNKEEPNTFFTEMVFKKVKPKENKGLFETLELKPCTYKKR